MTRRTSSLDRLPSPHPTFREDDSKIHVGCLPRIMAGLRNLAIGVHRQDGRTNMAAALRYTARDCRRPLTALGITG
ncbi:MULTISPECIES: hypothetical protein [Streptomyces]|uniref:hypothetical protein n=1 Tax=Streptomyces TaxID=1883 RepID=UPI00339E4C87